VEVVTEGTREGKPVRATHLYWFTRRTSRSDTSLRTTPQALLRLVRDRWSLEGWHWIRETQLHEDAHRYRGNGAGALANLRKAALNLLRLHGFQSIRSGLQAVCHDITALLAMATARQGRPRGYLSHGQAVTCVSVSHMRQHLPHLKRVQQGEAIQITSRGRVIVRLQAEQDPAEEARQWLQGLQGRVTLVDVLAPLGSESADDAWSGDAAPL
jgi:antitoxin (DNA-binding transcriptional repressor) of toxin-antitoxin stability system